MSDTEPDTEPCPHVDTYRCAYEHGGTGKRNTTILASLMGGVGVLVIANLIASIWWAGATTTRLQYQAEAIAELKRTIERVSSGIYTRADSLTDFKPRDDALNALRDRITSHESRIQKLEAKP